MNEQMRSMAAQPVKSFLVMLYSWIVIVFFGAVLLDTVYAGVIRRALDPAQAAKLFSEVSDFLLLAVGITTLAAIAAIGSCWRSSPACHLFVASGLLVVTEPLVPVLFRTADLESSTGLGIRLLWSGAASILALAGLSRFYHRS